MLLIEVYSEREHPPPPLWLGWQGPHRPLEVLWRAYERRWGIEPSIRLRKQQLAWTMPQVRNLDACDRWSVLVSLAQWQFYLARAVVADRPLPWQRPQQPLTPGRVQRGFGALFPRIGTPAVAPRRRGKAPGWLTGQPRWRAPQHPVVKKGQPPRNGGTSAAKQCEKQRETRLSRCDEVLGKTEQVIFLSKVH